MSLSISNKNSNYLAKVVCLKNVRKHPNADAIQLATVDFNTIIVGKNAIEGDLYVYFPLETAINPDFLSYTNSYSSGEMNRNKEVKGFFNKQGRVRAVKLRGIPSEGYVVPLEVFQTWLEQVHKACIQNLESIENVEFDTVNIGKEPLLICEKYVPQHIREKGPSNTPKKEKKFNRIVDGQFHFHVSTSQLKKNVHNIRPDDIITVTKKLHGTSLVCGNLLVKKQMPFPIRMLKYIGIDIQKQNYDLVYSSRNVIKNKYEVKKSHNHFYGEDIWSIAAKELQEYLDEGVTVYAEVVGQTPNGKWIQKGYDYGCLDKQHAIYIYRMTTTTSEGKVTEWSTSQIRHFVRTHGLKMVPILYHGFADGFTPTLDMSVDRWQGELLGDLMEKYLEKDCNMCSSKMPDEGVVVTVQAASPAPYKLKSNAFYLHETKQLDKNEVGMEE